jgi:homoserine dehydrogenase
MIETLGAGEPGLALALVALAAGRRVVSANKGNLAAEWQRLQRYTHGDRTRLRFSAAVGGAVPILEIVERQQRTDPVTSVRGVVNGTCNFVLDRMHEGVAYAQALAEAQAQGFAEADPQVDVSGMDAASKLTLIALKAFGQVPESVERLGIEGLAATAVKATTSCARAMKLVASVTREKRHVIGRVAPESLMNSDYLAGAKAEENRFEVSLESGETVRLSGRGAGRWPTTMAVMGDVWGFVREFSSSKISCGH